MGERVGVWLHLEELRERIEKLEDRVSRLERQRRFIDLTLITGRLPPAVISVCADDVTWVKPAEDGDPTRVILQDGAVLRVEESRDQVVARITGQA